MAVDWCFVVAVGAVANHSELAREHVCPPRAGQLPPLSHQHMAAARAQLHVVLEHTSLHNNTMLPCASPERPTVGPLQGQGCVCEHTTCRRVPRRCPRGSGSSKRMLCAQACSHTCPLARRRSCHRGAAPRLWLFNETWSRVRLVCLESQQSAAREGARGCTRLFAQAHHADVPAHRYMLRAKEWAAGCLSAGSSTRLGLVPSCVCS